jgi:hypothetical protein
MRRQCLVHASFEVRGFDLQVRCLDLQARSFGLQYLAESTVISSDYSLVNGRVMIGNWWLSKPSDSLYSLRTHLNFSRQHINWPVIPTPWCMCAC